MIDVVIVEDEEYAISRFKKILNECDISTRVLAELKSVKQAVKWFSENQADLVFLDIHLGDGNSFKIFDQVEFKIPVIYTTAYQEYAIRAFEFYGLDYLLKPINRERLRASLEKFQMFKNSGQLTPSVKWEELQELIQNPKKTKRFMVNVGNRTRVIGSQDIAYFSFDDRLTMLHTFTGQKYVLDLSLKRIESSLPAGDFFRVNRQYLCNRRAIKELQTHLSGKTQIHLIPDLRDTTVYITRDKITAFKEWLVD